nr:vespryn-like [Vicugna pacos]
MYFLSGRRKAQFKSVWRNAPLYADWRKEEFEAVNMTLDAATAHPALLLSEKGRQVTWQETCQDLPSSPQRFDSFPCVLGQPHIRSGRCYWEVQVKFGHKHEHIISRMEFGATSQGTSKIAGKA